MAIASEIAIPIELSLRCARIPSGMPASTKQSEAMAKTRRLESSTFIFERLRRISSIADFSSCSRPLASIAFRRLAERSSSAFVSEIALVSSEKLKSFVFFE